MTSASILLMTVAAIGAAPQGVVYDFTQTTCPPCRQMDPIVENLRQQGYAVQSVYPDRNPELFQKYNVNATPTFILVVHGKEVMRQSGVMAESQLRRWCMQIPINTPKESTPTPPKEVIVKLNEPKKQNPLARLIPGSSRNGSSSPGVFSVSENKNRRIEGIRWPLGGDKKNDQAVELESPSNSADVPVMHAALTTEEQVGGSEPAASASPDNAPRAAAGQPMPSSVRIRVRDESGMNFGSGTVIASKPGKALVLTCGHLFRDATAETVVEVDVFSNDRIIRHRGKIIDYNVEADVGLLIIAAEEELPFAPVANQFRKVSVGENVVSVGCGYGESPSAQKIQVTNLNQSVGGDTLVCTGVPVKGRSGGGLFDENGNVIGVCFARDTEDRRGWYAALKVIHQLLDKAKLSVVYRADENAHPVVAVAEAEVVEEADTDLALAADDDEQGDTAGDVENLSRVLADAGDAEVICIVRGRDGVKKRIVVINQASPSFVRYLTGEISPAGGTEGQASRRPATVDRGDDLPPSEEDRVLQETNARIRRYRRSKESQ